MNPGNINLNVRPSSYFWPLDSKKHVLNRITGTERRAVVARRRGSSRTAGGDLLELPQLDDRSRRELGRIHPSLMGGEYLPRSRDAEVEIARIDIKSTTYDATCLYARPGKSRIYYRVVDEYEGETLSEKTTRTSVRPLTLGEMTDFFLGAWDLFRVLECNFDDRLEAMEAAMKFFRGSSAHYPDFDQLLRERVIERLGPRWAGRGQDEEEPPCA